jgi:hypothetical protein
MGFAGTAAQNDMPAVIHSITGCSGLEAISSLAFALWSSTVQIARSCKAHYCLLSLDLADG